ncbi:hypothetical protein [Mucilaginibacter frigoritolerans]|uniref:hypothetical protein n=1 Tax=Mucilaginibacter frigoritolerans TaxID=652788 RepID=UPI0011A98CE2|nr:hypothetical protein [Mucilaginibacter frigoritolerans]
MRLLKHFIATLKQKSIPDICALKELYIQPWIRYLLIKISLSSTFPEKNGKTSPVLKDTTRLQQREG